MIAAQTCLNAHAIKQIDKKRLIDLYTEGGSCLIPPDHSVKRLGIDELNWLVKKEDMCKIVWDLAEKPGPIYRFQVTKKRISRKLEVT